MIRPLPKWGILNSRYAFNDVESDTAIEQTARLYAVIQDLITTYNNFETKMNSDLNNFETDMTSEFETCKANMTKAMNDFIECVNTKMDLQDLKIQNAEDYMKNKIVQTTTTIINKEIEDGNIVVDTQYTNDDEELDIIITNGGDE